MARNGIICSILFVYFMVVMPTTGQYCPKDNNPIIEDQTNCTFQIHNDTTAVQNILKMVANWRYGSIQDINIPIITSGNDKEVPSHGRIRLHEWVIRYIDPARPSYYISWRRDFDVLSFGLLNEFHSNPGFKLAIDETACGTFQYVSESTTREIVRTVSNYIRESKLLDKTYKYENINMCYLSVFEWFKNSPWYIMKKYFGVPFQEFGYKCCKLYKQTVCCNDKLYNINGDRLIPYIISVILICYVPLILLKVAKINHTFHPKYYHKFDNISDNGSQLDPSFMSMFDNIFCINTMCTECNNKIIDCIINWFKSRIGRLLFVLLLPCGIYFEFILFSLSKEWKLKIEDIDNENVLFGFTTMLVNIKNNTFLNPIGPFGFLLIYHVTGFFFLVLPDNFEENIVKKGIVDNIRIPILEELNQQGHINLPGYIQLEQVLTTCMFMVFNCNFWTNCKCLTSVKLLIFFLVFPLPVIPFTLIILIGYFKFAYCKYCPCTCNNMENKGATQNQTMNENTHLIGAEQTQPKVENNNNMGAEQTQPMVENNKGMGAEQTQPKVENNKDMGAEQTQPKVENNKDMGAEQNQTMVENNMDKGTTRNQTTVEIHEGVGADNNATCKCHRKCKTIMNIVYCCCCLPLLLFFAYTLVVIISYTVYIIVYIFYFMWWALVTSPTETADLLIFVFGGILFAYKIVKDGISFYKELFNLTIDVCQNEDCTKNKNIAFQNGIIYIKKDIVRKVQQAICPFYISIGYTIIKLIAVIFLYVSYFLVIKNHSQNTGNHDIFINVTMVITSALPTLVATQFKHKLPNKNIVKHIIHCY